MPVPENELLVPVGTISIDKHKSDKQTFSDASVKALHTTGATTMTTPSTFSINTLVAKYPGVASNSTGTTVSGTLTVPGVAQVQAMSGATYTADSMSTNVLSAMDDVSDTLVFDGKKVVLNSDVLVAGRIDTINTPVMNVVDKVIKIGAIDVNGDNVLDMDDFLRDGSGVVVPGPPANLPAGVLTPDLYEHSFKWMKKAGDFDSSGALIAPHSRPAWDFKSALAVCARDKSDRNAKFMFSPNFTSTSASLGMYYTVGDTSTLVSNFATEPFDWPGAPVWPADAVPTLPPIARGSVVNYQFGSTPVVRSASRGTRDVTNVAANTDRFSVVAGTLPTGLTLSESGLLSGTVTSVESYSFTVRAGCKYPSQYSDYVFSMDVAPEIIWQTAAGAISKIEKSVLSSRTLVATNCVAFTIVSGALPTGVSMTSGGVLSGTPTTDGISTFTVRATSTNVGVYVDREFTLQVATTPVWVTAGALTDVARNGPLSSQLSATNATSYVVQAGTLPTGASLSSGGLLTGPASTAGTFTVTIRAIGSAENAYADREFTLVVANTPSWVSAASMAKTSTSVAVSIQFDATYAGTYSVQSGALPTGLSLSSGGLLTGTPTTVESATFTVRAVSAASPLVYADRTFTFPTGTLPVWSTAAALTDVAKDVVYSVQLAASDTQTYALQSGALPAGVTLSSAGLLTGTPTAAGTFGFTVRAMGDATNAIADREFTLLVATTPTWTTAAALVNTAQGAAYSLALTATNANATGFTVTTGALPTGMTLSTGGVLIGTPTAASAYSFTVRALSTTSIVVFADRSFTLTVVPLPVWSSPSAGTLSEVASGFAYSRNFTATNAVTYTLSSGSIPGLSLSTAGLLSGTPTTSGTYNFTVLATGSATNAIASQSYTQLVATVPSGNPGTNLGDYTQGSTVSFNLSASNAGSYSLGGTYPGGLSFNTSTGYLTGNPTTSGSFSMTVRAFSTNSTAFYYDRTFTSNVAIAPVWSMSSNLGSYSPNNSISLSLTASNAGSYLLSSGTIPSGTSFNTSSGSLTGSPNTSQSYSFTIRAYSLYSNSIYTDQAFTITILSPWVAGPLPGLSAWTQGYSNGGNLSYNSSTGVLTFVKNVNHHDYGTNANIAVPQGFSSASGTLTAAFDFIGLTPFFNRVDSDYVGITLPNARVRATETGVGTPQVVNHQIYAGVTYRITYTASYGNITVAVRRKSDNALISTYNAPGSITSFSMGNMDVVRQCSISDFSGSVYR